MARASLRRTISGNATTPGWSGPEPPTSSPVSPFAAAASLSISYFPRSPSLQCANENHLISSPDPLQLFSPSARNYVDVDDHNCHPTNGDAVLRVGLVINAEPDALPSSSRESSPRLSNLLQRSPSSDPFVVPGPPIVHHDQISALEHGASPTGGRYSMRTRQPRQLKPYAFDRLEYTHQLKYHPDAIVKFHGHRNPVESSSSPPPCSDADDTDGAVEEMGGERPSEDPRVLPHAKQRKRHRTNTERPSAPLPTMPQRASGLHLPMGSPSLTRRGIGSPAIADRARVPDQYNDDSPEAAAAWYPDAFNDLSSGLGSDDALPLSTLQNDLHVNHTPRPRVKRIRVL